MSQSPILINISQLAKRLVVSRRTIHNWLRAGTCPVAPVQGMKPPKWRAADVEAFINARDNGAE